MQGMWGPKNQVWKVWLILAVPLVGAACGEVKSSAVDAAVDGANTDAGPTDGGPAAFVPLHVLPATLMSGAPDLVLNKSPSTIDTTSLTVNGASSTYFVRQAPYAVLFANAFAVQNPVVIQGTAPLIVVASDQVTVDANINLNATGPIAGPGAVMGGPGAGGPGTSFLVVSVGERESSGGGGGSYGTLGGPGGSGDPPNIPAGSSGVRYGMQPDAPLVGGSSGGNGGFAGGSTGLGGAGGGALQISSAVSIRISATINAGGGGGVSGGGGLAGGGGGGSGGEILLEAPSITMAGSAATLAANGGGGGGGGANGSMVGTNGSDGAPGPGPAAGGIGGIPQGSPGGAGAAGIAGSFTDAQAGGRANSKGGGGGGGAGRIWIRHRAAMPPSLNNARISPPVVLDPTLP